MNIGLTLGKFIPFHEGHRFMVQKALDEMDKVMVMVYEDDGTIIPVRQRANWIRKCFADCGDKIEVIECYNCPQEVGYTETIIKQHNSYILQKVGNKGITHFYSSEEYGEHVSKALKAIDRRVDMSRIYVPIRGTTIRENPYACRKFIPNVVYKDLIVKVAFLGSESTGKSTMAKVCADAFNSKMVREYGEEYWKANNLNGILTPEQLGEIAKKQIELEEETVLEANGCLFCDTTPLTTYMFCIYYHGRATDDLWDMARKSERIYDVVFVCDTDIPFDPSNGRRSREINLEQQKILIDELRMRKIPFIMLKGSIEERLKTVERTLKALPSKWR